MTKIEDLTNVETLVLNKLLGRIIDYKYKLMVQGVNLEDKKIYITEKQSEKIGHQKELLGFELVVTDDEQLLKWGI